MSEPVEQGASMELGLPDLVVTEEDRSFAREVLQNSRISPKYSEFDLVVGIMASRRRRDLQLLAALTKARDLKAEVSKLSTRIDEYEASETRAVEKLARVREENQELRQVVIGMRDVVDGACDIGFLDTDRAASLVIKSDALLAPKPLDTNEGGE